MRNYRLSSRNKAYDEMPLIGPASYEEAIERIELGVQEMESGEGSSWEEVKEELLEEVYAGQVHNNGTHRVKAYH